MARTRTRSSFHEPSLVPLADMLTNTVGVVVFILIFTVLTAGGAVVAKRLPMERQSMRDPVVFICEGGRVVPLLQATEDRFSARLPKGQINSMEELESRVTALSRARIEDEFVVLTGTARKRETASSVGIDFMKTCTVKPGAGFLPAVVKDRTGPFRDLLKTLDPQKEFCMFLVRPDSLGAYAAARDAVAAAGFASGWSTMPTGRPIRFGSGGRQMVEQ